MYPPYTSCLLYTLYRLSTLYTPTIMAGSGWLVGWFGWLDGQVPPPPPESHTDSSHRQLTPILGNSRPVTHTHVATHRSQTANDRTSLTYPYTAKAHIIRHYTDSYPNRLEGAKPHNSSLFFYSTKYVNHYHVHNTGDGWMTVRYPSKWVLSSLS